MKNLWTAGVLGFAIAAGGCGAPVEDVSDETQALEQQTTHEHSHLQRDAKPGGSGGSALMTSHGGAILVANTTHAIWWGSEWNTASFAGDKITGNSPDPAALYLIYTATGAGHVSYCAWHSWGTCSNGAPIQVAYMPNIDGIAGCDPQDTWTTHSQGLAAVANVTAHELAETITD
ncbi:MAG: hypothetical protein JWM53_5698, partial [bacterium]|nr:hypothetical protein [bacterium]